MRARDVMATEVASVAPHIAVVDAARFLLERHISGAPVVDDDGRLVGIVSEGDLMRRAETGTDRRPSWWLALLTSAEDAAREYLKTHGRRVADVMTADVITVDEDTPLADVAAILERRRIKRVPVVRDHRVIGIVSRADLLRALAATKTLPPEPSLDDRAIRERLLAHLDEANLAHGFYANVVVSNGVVHLWGLVETEDERRAMEAAAHSIPGVRSVENNVTVGRIAGAL